MSQSTYSRKLSAIERYNIVINAATTPYNVEAVVEGKGELRQDAWQNAVNIAAEANPGIRITLRNALGFTRWVDSGINPVVKHVEAPDWNGYSEKGLEHLKHKFDPHNGGPVCDVLLLPGDPARVIFRALHGAVDARGLVHFIMDVMRVLRGEPVVGSHSRLTDLDVRLQHQDKVNVVKQPPMECIPAMPAAKPSPEPLEYVWRRVRIDKNIANMLPKMAIFLARQARQHGEGDVAFTVPVDFRGLRVQINSTANLTGYLKIKVLPEDGPRDVMKRINQEVRDHGDCYNPGIVKLVPWLSLKFLQKQLLKDLDKLLYTPSKGLPTGGIVSLGLFKPDHWSCPDFRAESIVGIPGSVGKLNVLIHNYTDNIQIVFSTPEAYNTEGQLDRLIADFKAEFDPQIKADAPDSRPEKTSEQTITPELEPA